MYTLEQFNALVVKNVGDYFKATHYEVVSVDILSIPKNNGQSVEKLSIRTTDENGIVSAVPNIPTEYAYSLYQMSGGDLKSTMEQIVEKYVELVKQTPEVVNDTDKLFSVQYIMDNCFMRVVNSSTNEQALQNSPHKEMLDLSIMYRVKVNEDEGGLASYVVTNEILERVGISPEMLHEAAFKNTQEMFPVTVTSLGGFLANSLGSEEFGCETETQIFSNAKNLYGATSIVYTDKIQEIAEKYDSNLLVFPSSIHEVLLMPGDKEDIAAMSGMVTEINSMAVDLEEQLSNQIYFYDKDAKSLTIATDQPELKDTLCVAEQKHTKSI